MTTPNFTLAVKSIKSINDSTEVGSDEPYILVVAADLNNLVPITEATLYGPWADVDKGETHATLVIPVGTPQPLADVLATLNVIRRPFWGPAPIVNAVDALFVVCVVEHDDGNPQFLKQLVDALATQAFFQSRAKNKSNADIAKAIFESITGSIGTATGFPNLDDVVGVHQLKLTQSDLTSGSHVLPTLHFVGGSQGSFDVQIELTVFK